MLVSWLPCLGLGGKVEFFSRYRNPGVGNIAINDSFMLESSIYYMLKKHLKSDPAYIDYLELFLEVRRASFGSRV